MTSSSPRFLISIFFALAVVCIPHAVSAALEPGCHTFTHEGTNQYYFDDFESAEYVNGLLVIHFRLKTPFNDGRIWHYRPYVFFEGCGASFSGALPVTVTPGIQAWSIRFTSPATFEIWNDEANIPETCAFCRGNLDALSPGKEFALQASVDGGFPDQFLSSSFPIVEPTPPIANCCSSVLFLPGLQASRLVVGDDTIWPPTPGIFSNDVQQLALDAEGESVHDVRVDGIINTFYGASVYDEFSNFLNSMTVIDPQTGTSTIVTWDALAYDWRFDPEQIIAEGVHTTRGHTDPVSLVEELAANSYTGKVAIVAHSNGGLVGKALIRALIDQEKEELIESFVMVGVPQLGTPQAVSGLLHGDGQAIPGGFIFPNLIANPAKVRTVSQNMPGPYHLLPSPQYLIDVTSPVVKFDDDALFTEDWRQQWGTTLDSYIEFISFLTGAAVPRTSPPELDLRSPTILDPQIILEAKEFHDTYDSFVYPDSIRVVQVAGWGLPTTKTISYENSHFLPSYATVLTREGDRTVVYASAHSDFGESYFFNMFEFNDQGDTNVQHRDFLNTEPMQNLFASVLKGKLVSEGGFISTNKPTLADIGDQLLVSSHSPVILSVSDESGNFTGVLPTQDLSADLLIINESIPGSSFLTSGESQYIFLPKDGIYKFVVQGVGSGPTTIKVQDFVNDVANDRAIYSDITFATTTRAVFEVGAVSGEDVRINVDTDGDGDTNYYVADDSSDLTLEEIIFNLKDSILGLTAKDKLRERLVKKVEGIEKKVEKNKRKKASKAVKQLEKKLKIKTQKGKLLDTELEEIFILLDEIERLL